MYILASDALMNEEFNDLLRAAGVGTACSLVFVLLAIAIVYARCTACKRCKQRAIVRHQKKIALPLLRRLRRRNPRRRLRDENGEQHEV